MEFILLPTDLLLFFLFFCLLGFIFFCRRYEHLRAPWRKVGASKLGVISLVILLVYILIGLVDSIHFTKPAYAGKVKSLLDVIVSPLGSQDEKTYSAPFASHLFMKSVMELPNGEIIQTYPKLNYGGAHLSKEDSKKWDITKRILIALFYAAIIWLILGILFITHFQKKLKAKKTTFAWPAFFVTVGVFVLLIACFATLSTHYHIFGTGKVGQDIFYEAIKSIRTGLVIGTITTLITLPFAIFFGMIAGYFGGWSDDIIQYLYTTLSSIPGVLLITAAILSLQIYIENHPELFSTLALRADIRLLALCVILGITSWTSLCRLLRAETLKIREMDFVSAAITLGTQPYKILLQHILPNLVHLILITIVLDFSGLVLAEAVLSYVGVGVDPSTISWGNMINSARLELAREPVVWWPLFTAFIFMFIFVLAANLFADIVRDAFDPKGRP